MSPRNGDLLEVSVERTGTTVQVAVRGEVDISTVEQLRQRISRELAADGEILLIDLTEVSFIDSSGLRAILEAAALAPERVRVIPGPVALRLFTITGVADRLPLTDRGDGGSRPHSADGADGHGPGS